MNRIESIKSSTLWAFKSLTCLALICTVSNYSANTIEAGGKLEAAVEGGKLALEYGEKLGTLLTGLDRSATIVIANHTNRKLTNLRVYADSGKIVDFQGKTSIDANSVGGVVAEKSNSALAGAVGVISYEIEGTDKKLFILYSVPYNQTEASKDCCNWFVARVANSKDWDPSKETFNQFYNNSKSLRQAGRGVEKWEETAIVNQAAYDAEIAKINATPLTSPAQMNARLNAIAAAMQKFSRVKWRMEGTMVNAGKSKIVIDFREVD